METLNIYRMPPAQKIFEEVRDKSIHIWTNYGNSYGWLNQKLDAIKAVNNVGDSFLFIVAMFDLSKQELLAYKLSTEARLEVRKRLLAAEVPERYIAFYE